MKHLRATVRWNWCLDPCLPVSTTGDNSGKVYYGHQRLRDAPSAACCCYAPTLGFMPTLRRAEVLNVYRVWLLADGRAHHVPTWALQGPHE